MGWRGDKEKKDTHDRKAGVRWAVHAMVEWQKLMVATRNLLVGVS